MQRILVVATLLCLIGQSPLTSAGEGGDPAAGKAKADQLCTACHKPNGEGVAEQGFPKLAGQWDSYIVRALRDYRSGARKNAIMSGLAAALTDEEIANLAAFYSQQPDGLKTLAH